jgi:hypothetical protein
MDGGTIEHIVGGQMGGRSIELLHSGCISPSTQRQTQEASHSTVRKSAKTIARMKRIIPSLFLGRTSLAARSTCNQIQSSGLESSIVVAGRVPFRHIGL